ncbi:MAG: OmpA family protein [Thermodesulfovibrionales bacterium]|nr:OmpA family protein [Thermodesulfovibrionales bacterium]
MADKNKFRIPEPLDNTDRWVVSYADFITLLFAFFTTMYAISHVDMGKLEKFTGSMKEAFKAQKVTQHFTPIEGIKPIQHEALQIEKELKYIIQESGKIEGIRITVEEEGVRLSFADTIIFESGSAEIKEEIKPLLLSILSLIKKTNNPVVIEGHTDNIPVKGSRYSSNWELSAARATGVLMFLLSDGSLDPSRFSVAGYGEYRPVAPNTTPEGRAKNRRVDIIFLVKKIR